MGMSTLPLQWPPQVAEEVQHPREEEGESRRRAQNDDR